MKGNPLRSWILTGALAVGAAVGAAAVANAASGSSSSGKGSGSFPSFFANGAPAQPPPLGRNSQGPGETLLTGSAASKARAAALAAVPGGTVLRVETDSGPAACEAHVRKADGTPVTVKLDSSFHGPPCRPAWAPGRAGRRRALRRPHRPPSRPVSPRPAGSPPAGRGRRSGLRVGRHRLFVAVVLLDRGNAAVAQTV